MGAIITFFAAGILLTLLLGLKHYELASDRRVFGGWRSRADMAVVRFFAYLQALPGWCAHRAHLLGVSLLQWCMRCLLSVLKYTEERIRAVLQLLIRGKRTLERREPASPFFKDIAAKKQQWRDSGTKGVR